MAKVHRAPTPAARNRGPLAPSEVQYVRDRLIPFYREVMLAHGRLDHEDWRRERGIPEAAQLGSMIAGRIILEFLGIRLHPKRHRLIGPSNQYPDDVTIADIGGKLADLERLKRKRGRYKTFRSLILMAHKTAGHLTVRERRPYPNMDQMLRVVDQQLQEQMRPIGRGETRRRSR
jgi:hypothetical protein